MRGVPDIADRGYPGRMVVVKLLLKGIAIIAGALVVGLCFGILPCYVFPPLGGSLARWCGYKDAPPHFGLQFGLGALAGAGGVGWLFWRRARGGVG